MWDSVMRVLFNGFFRLNQPNFKMLEKIFGCLFLVFCCSEDEIPMGFEEEISNYFFSFAGRNKNAE